ncbi:MAG: FHIPEP family type III secretion protein [Planctomycetota bacterium]|jgi:hypothetical protein
MSVCCEANSNGTDSRAGFCELSQNSGCSRIVSRNDFLFAATVIAIIVGFLFPLSAYLLDVLSIFSVCLTAAALIITFSAKQALQVQGFPLLIVSVTILRIILSVASTKLIFSEGDAGTVINLFGDIIVRNNPATPGATLLFSGTLAVAIFAAIFKVARGINRSTSEFSRDIAPARQIFINSDSNAGVISGEQADSLREKIAREAGFFIAMSGTARFIICAAVIELVIVFVNSVASMAVGVIGATSTVVPAETYATLTVGAGLLTQMSALLAATACGYLVRKSLVHPTANSEPTGAKRIKVVSSELPVFQDRQSRHDNTIGYVESAEHIAGEKPITKETQWFDEETFDENEKENSNLWNWQEIKDNDGYNTVTELIESRIEQDSPQVKTILMAAESVEELGVTVPVNIAIRLAQKGQECLLIDLDRERDAISKVFDIDINDTQTKAIATCIKNLWVRTVRNYSEANTVNLKTTIANQQEQYDCLVVYAPKIEVSADSNNLAGCAQIAMLFGSGRELKSPVIGDLHRILTDNGCEILEPKHILTKAV